MPLSHPHMGIKPKASRHLLRTADHHTITTHPHPTATAWPGTQQAGAQLASAPPGWQRPGRGQQGAGSSACYWVAAAASSTSTRSEPGALTHSLVAIRWTGATQHSWQDGRNSRRHVAHTWQVQIFVVVRGGRCSAAGRLGVTPSSALFSAPHQMPPSPWARTKGPPPSPFPWAHPAGPA